MHSHHTPSCCSVETQPKLQFSRKTIIVILGILFLINLSYFIPRLVPFRESFFMYFREIWWAVLLGFLIGGLIDRFIPREYVVALLAKPKKRTILYSVSFGFLMSACSHGILALSIELHKKGASVPTVVSFLLASPWANLPITFMLIGFFGLKALYIIAGALAIAFITGMVFQFLDKKNLIEKNKNTILLSEDFSVSKNIQSRFRAYSWSTQQVSEDVREVLKGAFILADMVLWWLLLGIVISSLASTFIPGEIFRQYMGPSLLGLLATLGLAMVMEVCSEGTAPLAFELYKQTGAFGNAFVFLMAGVVTDYTEIGLIWSNIGRKAALWLPVIAVPQALILGIIANYLFR